MGLIEDQNALQLGDALRNVSGVQFDFGFNGSAMPLSILRGFSSVSMTAMGSMSGSATYYIDGSKVTGVPINMANVLSVKVVIVRRFIVGANQGKWVALLLPRGQGRLG